jgi:hypothetical protein
MTSVWYVLKVILVWFAIVLAFLFTGGIGPSEVGVITLVVTAVAIWRRPQRHRQMTA